jgi:hypothetical protein
MTKLRRILFIIFICHILATNSYSQNRDSEVGAFLGMSQYFGDLVATNKLNPQSYGFAVLYRKYLNPWISVRANVFYGQVTGSDYDKKRDSKYAWTRNLSFKSHIFDVSALLEIGVKPFVSGRKKKTWAPYLLGGIAVFNFDPKAEYHGKWYRLQPLGLEGQGTPKGGPKYNLTEISIPYGFGIKYGFKKPKAYKAGINLELWNISLELVSHLTFTDHIDDVGGYYPESLEIFNGNEIAMALCDRSGEIGQKSRIKVDSKRGNPDKMDGYFWYGITITKTFRASKCFRF